MLAASLSPMAASAAPIQLSVAEFIDQVHGSGSGQIEGFEGDTPYRSNARPTPFVFQNGTFTPPGAVSVVGTGSADDTLLFCGVVGDRCLTDRNQTGGVRSFSAFPEGTTHIGITLHYLNPSNPINVVITGGSGVLDITETGTSFLGFTDPLGITSVTFENLGPLGGYNYSFDDVITAQVPEPSTLALFCMGLAGLILRRRSGPA